ncbi:MAG: RHS repeat-associated core domain-containing protein [Opitutales bacterium]|nr:RHS repeat-associated core domain-containing protein [Opitutales bacterium]
MREVTSIAGNGTTQTRTFNTYTDYSNGRMWRVRRPDSFHVIHEFDTQLGHVNKIRDNRGNTWWESPLRGAAGTLREFRLPLDTGIHPQAFKVERVHEKGSRYLGLINIERMGGPPPGVNPVFRAVYDYDNLGNLVQRRDQSMRGGVARTLVESFRYDGLNRLRGSALANLAPHQVPANHSYNALGNLLSKPGTNNNYDSARFNRLSWTYQADLGGWMHSQYNGRGELTGRYDQVNDKWQILEWHAWGKPRYVYNFANSKGHSFVYGAGLEQVGQHGYHDDKRTWLASGGLYQVERAGTSAFEHRTQLIPLPGGATARLVEIYNNGFFVEGNGSYTVGDHLGSASLVLSRTGSILSEFSFDAWGQPRDPDTWQNLPLFSAWPNYPADQGFGGHRMLDGTGLVHMGGRLYDPATGRFLSPDPFVQEPNNLQNYNRYSYVLNNPLSYTDPSGYFIDKAWDWAKSTVKGVAQSIVSWALASIPVIGPFLAVAFNGYMGYRSGGWAGAAYGGIQGYYGYRNPGGNFSPGFADARENPWADLFEDGLSYYNTYRSFRNLSRRSNRSPEFTEESARQAFRSFVNREAAIGRNFSSMLGQTFLDQSFPAGAQERQTAWMFEVNDRFALQIKMDPHYREAAQVYFGNLARRLGPGRHELHTDWRGREGWFDFRVRYAPELSDLGNALGGGSFGVAFGTLHVGRFGWHFDGRIYQIDEYTFRPTGRGNLRLSHHAYSAGHFLERNRFLEPFWHVQQWDERFSSNFF